MIAGSTGIEWRKYLSHSLSPCAQRTENIFKAPKIRVEVFRSNFCYRTSKLINKPISSVVFLQPMGLKVNVLPHLWDAFGDFSVKNLFVHGDTCFYATLID